MILLLASSSVLGFTYFFFLVLKCLLASCFTLFRLFTLLWFRYCNHCILVCFLWCKYHHSSSNRGLCCFNSYRPRLFSAEVLTFSSMFCQALFLSLLNISQTVDNVQYICTRDLVKSCTYSSVVELGFVYCEGPSTFCLMLNSSSKINLAPTVINTNDRSLIVTLELRN